MKATVKTSTILLLLSILTLSGCKTKQDPIPTPTKVSDIHLTLGNPSNATKDIGSFDNYLLQKSQYTLSYNSNKGTANWVCWKLNPTSLGSTPRQDDYRADNSLPSEWYHVTETDFYGSGFDRGHLCPSGDRTDNVENNSATFVMSNMIPQAPNNNQITWGDLEDYCRDLVYNGHELYIIAGPHGTGGTGNNGGITYSLAGGKVIVPQSVWKIVVVLSPGYTDAASVTSNTRIIAVNMPNTQSVSNHTWGYYRTSVDQLELLTGYDFLSNVSNSVQSTVEATIDNGPTY